MPILDRESTSLRRSKTRLLTRVDIVFGLHRYLFAISTLVVAPVAAQPAGIRLDLTAGLSTVQGGTIDFRTGLLADLLATGRVRSLARSSIVAGLGASGILGGMGDRCLLLSQGGCAGKGNFAVVTALLGVDRAVGGASLRLLTGPSYHNGASDESVGLQGRFDIASSAFAHFALGVMSRVTMLPNHDDATLVS